MKNNDSTYKSISEVAKILNLVNSTTGDLGLPEDPSVYTSIPVDFSEWYFIVASFNPSVLEDDSLTYHMGLADYAPGEVTPLSQSPEFWTNNMSPY